jgi:hypothetical protein
MMTVCGVSSAVLVAAWHKGWTVQQTVGVCMLSLAILLAITFAVGYWADEQLDDAFLQGGQAYWKARVSTAVWIEISKWGNRTNTLLATVAAGVGVIYRMWWCLPILVLLMLMWFWFLIFMNGLPRVV